MCFGFVWSELRLSLKGVFSLTAQSRLTFADRLGPGSLMFCYCRSSHCSGIKRYLQIRCLQIPSRLCWTSLGGGGIANADRIGYYDGDEELIF